MKLVLTLIGRDLAREWRSGSWWLPVAFFLLVATLYPFAVGPDAALLRRTGGGILWVAALLAALLPVERLFAPDRDAGLLDQLALRGVADETVAAAKLVSHSVGFAMPLLLATVPGAALLDMDGQTWGRLVTGLAIGAPALAGLGVMIAAITLGQRGSSALGGLLLLPLAIPVLIFGAGMLDPLGHSAILSLAAASLVLVAMTPFAAGAALRGAREA
jgi:heme exporter protein B